jgi:DNA-binding FadR family transcriptional regulator
MLQRFKRARAPETVLETQTVITTNERATPSLVYRALLKGIQSGTLVPGAKLPNELELAQQLNTSRNTVRRALAIMERQGLLLRRPGSGTFLTDDADRVFGKMDRIQVADHTHVPSFLEIVEGRLLLEPAMMHLVVKRIEPQEIEAMWQNLREIQEVNSWREFKELIYALHEKMFAATKNRFLNQIVESIIADRRAVVFDGKDVMDPPPEGVRKQYHVEFSAIVQAIEEGKGAKAEELVSDHLMRMLATINIWQ